jgi:hypothetical protein
VEIPILCITFLSHCTWSCMVPQGPPFAPRRHQHGTRSCNYVDASEFMQAGTRHVDRVRTCVFVYGQVELARISWRVRDFGPVQVSYHHIIVCEPYIKVSIEINKFSDNDTKTSKACNMEVRELRRDTMELNIVASKITCEKQNSARKTHLPA